MEADGSVDGMVSIRVSGPGEGGLVVSIGMGGGAGTRNSGGAGIVGGVVRETIGFNSAAEAGCISRKPRAIDPRAICQLPNFVCHRLIFASPNDIYREVLHILQLTEQFHPFFQI